MLIAIAIITHIMVIIIGVSEKEIILGENKRTTHIDTR
jgi:hypothetical protein